MCPLRTYFEVLRMIYMYDACFVPGTSPEWSPSEAVDDVFCDRRQHRQVVVVR